jgi:DNA-binding response OmpR family regulator
VVVWSSADPEQDIQLAYELGAQSYLVKPTEYKTLAATVRGIKDYWIDLNVLPGDIL